MIPFYQMNSKTYGKGGEDVDFSDDTWGSGPAAGVIGSKRGGGNFGGPGGKKFGGRGGGNFGSSGGNYGRPGGFTNNRGPGGPGGFGNGRGPGGPGGFGGGGGGRNWDDGDDGWDNGGGPVGNDYNRDRYSNAYGNYQGGYGPPRFGGSPAPLMGPVFGPRGPGFQGGPGPGFQGGPGPAFQGGPGPAFQGGPGPMRPPNPIKFLTRCGVDMNTIQSWPRSVLRLCLPNHCGVCSMDCDNFAFARMHYTSKNHAKHIKKFMLDTRNSGPTEDPLKARDLYCELCDVHITSKVHGDSHYAGKSHRSIVDGNKPPKNPKLNQPGAYNRRDRLIKRELKFLKQETVSVPSADKKEVETKKGEWYCEICKSNMSCSDQMTAHLNGKRHLSKEKQHILNVMKGEKEAKEKAAAAAAAAAAGNGTADVEVIDADADDEAEIVEDDDTDDVEDNTGAAAAPEDDSWVHGTGEGWDNENNASGDSEEPLLFVRRE